MQQIKDSVLLGCYAEQQGYWQQTVLQYSVTLLTLPLCVAADGGREKHKTKKAKPDSISKRTTKKAKAQAVVPEKRAIMSEATGNISKISSNKVQENDTFGTPNQILFSSSLYTQELSNNKTRDPNDKLATEISPATNTGHVSAPESTKPSKNTEEQETTDGTEVPSYNDNETQFNITSTLDETIINCSQDLFSSQTATAEQNMSEKNKADTANRISTDVALHKLCTSSAASSRNVNANHENKNSEFTAADSCMATVGEKSDSGQIQTADCTDRVLDVVAGKNTASDEAANDEDNHRSLTEVGSSASVLQPDMHNPSTSTAPTGSHSNCSDSMPLVPDIQQNNFQTNANQHCDAVVPQLEDDNSDDNSRDTLDFEPEE